VPGYGARIRAIVSPEARAALVAEADAALEGRIRCFSRWEGDFGNPVDWHRNPRRGVSWPARVHWSKALAFEPRCGDVKLTWEANRFPHAFAMVRAWAITGDSRYVRGFAEQLRAWEAANPFRGGVNWSSGQELAIRAVAWCFAFNAFAGDPAFGEDDFRRLRRQLRLHGRHIARHIGFSRLAVHNNHLIGEALGLYLIGGCFPDFPEAAAWKRTGRGLLAGECLRQFRPDGGYCQDSHNYHRLALHYYLWACRLGECRGEPFPREAYETVAASAEQLAAFLEPADGRLPNWGANDGALLNPWTACDYADFRPVLSAARYLTARERAFAPGPWDEELLWLFGPEAAAAGERPYPGGSRSFPVSGLHALRAENGFAAFRCGSVTDRFGQADQLHVDLRRDGVEVAGDGGSYLYNDELPFHRHFMGSASHNTVTVDGCDQMLLHRRFKWLHWTRAALLDWRPAEEGGGVAAGEHHGYRRIASGPVVHRRRVLLSPDGCEVEDRLLPEGAALHAYRLHWLLGDFPFSVAAESPAGPWTIRFTLPRGEEGTLRLSVRVEDGSEPSPSVEAVRAVEGDRPRGWVSRYYGERSPALSVTLSATASAAAIFRSEFRFGPSREAGA
jgi:asparagine synthase (glutamine-hydrolysing)